MAIALGMANSELLQGRGRVDSLSGVAIEKFVFACGEVGLFTFAEG